MVMNYIIYNTKFYGTGFNSDWSDLSLEQRPPTQVCWTGTNISGRNPSVDRIWDRECGNERESEEKVCCTNCYGDLAGSLGNTVWLLAGCGGGWCDNLIWLWMKDYREDVIEVLKIWKCALSQSSRWKCWYIWFFRKCVVSGLRNPLVGIHRK